MRYYANVSVLALLALVFSCTSLFAEPADKPDPYAVPEGSAQELVDFLIKLTKVKPTNAEEGNKMRAALIKAADGILAAKPDEKQLALAVSAKSQALSDDLDKLAEFAAELKKGGQEKHAREVRRFALICKLKLVPLTPNNIKERATEFVDFISEGTIDAGADAKMALNAGQMAELSGDAKFAAQTYRKLQEIFSGSGDQNAVRFGKLLGGTVRRMELPGNPIVIEGGILGGEKFDWSKYEGKVVLVNFFATWCGPCRKEIETIAQCYDRYHDKGFDVVGISTDSNPASIEKYVKDKKLPWAIVYGDKKPSPTAEYYGITGIPQLILVGKDGKVISINARGPALVKELEKLFGSAEEKTTHASGA